MLIIIVFIYYFISITTLWICYYFRRFTEKDYKYNNSLRWKRRFAIILTYAMVFFQITVCSERKIFFYTIDNYFILYSACFFIIAAIFATNWVETIRHPFIRNKKIK